MEIEDETKSEAKIQDKAQDGASDAVDGQITNPEDEMIILEETDDETSTVGKLSLYSIAGKKTAAQGLMDVALITSNANQLRYLLEYNRGSHTFHLTVGLIALSLALQVGVAIFLIFKSRYYVTGESKSRNARRVKKCVLLMVFLVTVVNVFVASFTTLESNGNKLV